MRVNDRIDVVRRILQGDTQVVSHAGTSQYAQGAGKGISACGIAALNCARCLLPKASHGDDADAFLHNLVTRETVEVLLIPTIYMTELPLSNYCRKSFRFAISGRAICTSRGTKSMVSHCSNTL